jgi:type I restriction enzyme S subunit
VNNNSGWAEVVLEDVLTGTQYGTSAPTVEGGTRPVVGMRNIDRGTLTLNGLSFLDEAGQDWSSLELREGDILLNRTNSAELVGKIGIVRQDTDAVFASYLVRLHADRSIVDPYYLCYWLNGSVAQRAIKRLATRGVSQANINPSTLIRHCPVLVPSLAEQRKIADILRTWDNAIEILERRTAELQALRQHLIVRVLADTPDVERVPLGDLATVVTRKNSIDDTNVLTSSARLGLVSQSEYYNKSVSGSDISGYYLLEKGEFAYNRSSSKGYPYGTVRRLNRYPTGVLSTLYLCFALHNSERVDSDFITHLFDAGIMDPQFAMICAEGARSHGLLNVSRSDFFELVLPLPPIERQRKISGLLGDALREIELTANEISALRLQKRGLMQKLLTGELRVDVRDDLIGG